MTLHFFAIPALTPQPAQDEFNRFCRVKFRVLVSLQTAQLAKDALQLVYSTLPSGCLTPLFEQEGLGEIFKINPPRSPFVKGGKQLNLPVLNDGMPSMAFTDD